MERTAQKLLRIGAAFGIAAIAGSAFAQAPQPQTPRNWNYEVDQRGNRVPRGNRVTKPDGSWREEVRHGNCVTIKERAATGEYKETRECNPATPS
jgi:hypothetical protein